MSKKTKIQEPNPKESSNNFTDENLATTKKKLEDLKENFQAEKESEIPKVKKPRGKAAQKLKEDAEKKEFESTMIGVGSTVMNMFLERMSTPKPLTHEEENSLNKVTSGLMFKYFDSLGNYQEETAFLTVVFVILASRIDFSSFGKKKVEEIKEDSVSKE